MPFSPQTIGFLLQNKIQNDRNWFAEHREEYQQYVLVPLEALVVALTPVMHSIDPQLVCEPKVGKSISRIYRDTRFSHDKSIFRENMWCVFTRIKKNDGGRPGFFFDISPDGFSYGYGYYQTDRKSLARMRSLIMENDTLWQRADHAFLRQKIFTMDSELYRRNRYPVATERQCAWGNRKNICWIHHSDSWDQLFSETLAHQLSSDFLLLKPMSQFLTYVEETKDTIL